MLRVLKKGVCCVLVICMLSSLLGVGAGATLRSSDYLDSYSASLTARSGGQIIISVLVDALGNMTKLGASTIYLYESKDGSTYSCIKTYNSSNYAAMMSTGRHFAKDVITYSGTAGYKYFAVVYVYAGDSSGYDEQSYTTSSVKAF